MQSFGGFVGMLGNSAKFIYILVLLQEAMLT